MGDLREVELKREKTMVMSHWQTTWAGAGLILINKKGVGSPTTKCNKGSSFVDRLIQTNKCVLQILYRLTVDASVLSDPFLSSQ